MFKLNKPTAWTLLLALGIGLLMIPAGSTRSAGAAEPEPGNAVDRDDNEDRPQRGGRDGFQRDGREGRRQGAQRDRKGGRFAGRLDAMRRWRQMDAAERDALRTFLEENFPERYEEFTELEVEDPQLFGRHLRRVLPQLLRMKALSENDPESFQMHRQEIRNEYELRHLARRIHLEDDEVLRAGMIDELRPLVEKQYDLRLDRMKRELAKVREKTNELERRIAQHDDHRAAKIDRLMDRIIEGQPPDDDQRGPRRRGGRRRGDRFDDSLDDDSMAVPAPKPKKRR